MSFRSLAVFGVVLFSATMPASASDRYYYCTVNIGSAYPGTNIWPVAQSGIVSAVEAIRGEALGKSFYAYINPKYRETFNDGCQGFDTFEEADNSMKRRKEKSPGDVLTGWTGSFPPANPSADQKEASPGGAFISVKDSGRAAEIAAWKNSVLQMQRESAALQAKTIALTAASRAEHDRLLAKVKAEMKKRGNKQ